MSCLFFLEGRAPNWLPDLNLERKFGHMWDSGIASSCPTRGHMFAPCRHTVWTLAVCPSRVSHWDTCCPYSSDTRFGTWPCVQAVGQGKILLIAKILCKSSFRAIPSPITSHPKTPMCYITIPNQLKHFKHNSNKIHTTFKHQTCIYISKTYINTILSQEPN